MHSPRGPSALQALYRVFILPTLSKPAPKRPLSHHYRQLPLPNKHTIRQFSPSTHHLAKTRAPEARAQKWDNEITARIIRLVDPESGRLHEQPRTKWDVLNSLDSKTHRLVQVSPDPAPDEPIADFIPVCKIVSKKETYMHEKRRKEMQKEAKKVAARGSDAGMKTLEINWAIDGNDLSHRLDKVRAFLQAGRRVEVVLAGKKGGRKATREECEGVLAKIREVVDGVQGAKERRALEGTLGRFATVVFQGPAPHTGKVVAAAEGSGSEDEEGK